MARFTNRRAAGKQLADQLIGCVGEHALVLALPRGGVPVGFEIACALAAPLDIWVVRKIGAPWNPELGLGAVAQGGFVYVNRELVAALGLHETHLLQLVEATRNEVAQRVKVLRPASTSLVVEGKDVVVVDDGLATGGTALASVLSIRAQEPRSIVLAVPVAAHQALPRVAPHTDRVVCLECPVDLKAVGFWYDDFSSVSDGCVRELLREVKVNSRD